MYVNFIIVSLCYKLMRSLLIYYLAVFMKYSCPDQAPNINYLTEPVWNDIVESKARVRLLVELLVNVINKKSYRNISG